MNVLFCDKYKPKNSSDVIGNVEQISRIVYFLKSFQKSKHKCLLITGDRKSVV